MATALWVTADDLSHSDVPEAHEAALSASFLMWSLSGRRYSGPRQVTESYTCPCSCSSVRPHQAMLGVVWPSLINGQMYNVRAGHGGACGSCGQPHRLRLRGTPIHSIQQVRSNGSIVNPDDYEIHDDVFLAPSSGAGWSVCDNIEVTYTYGVMPPESGRRAARLLAEELLKAKLNPDECRLPDRITSVSRQGVSFTILDPQSFLDEGKLGIYEVDAFLRAVNPEKARRPARVFSPDMPRGRRVRKANTARVAGPYDLTVASGADLDRVFYGFELHANLSSIDNWTPVGHLENGTSLDAYLTKFDDGSVRLLIPGAVTGTPAIASGTYTINANIGGDATAVVHLVTGRITKTP